MLTRSVSSENEQNPFRLGYERGLEEGKKVGRALAAQDPGGLDELITDLEHEGAMWEANQRVQDATGEPYPVLTHQGRRRAAWMQLLGRVRIPSHGTWQSWWRRASWNFLTISRPSHAHSVGFLISPPEGAHAWVRKELDFKKSVSGSASCPTSFLDCEFDPVFFFRIENPCLVCFWRGIVFVK